MSVRHHAGKDAMVSSPPATPRELPPRLTSVALALIAGLLVVAHLLDPDLLMWELVYAAPLAFSYR